MFKKEYLSKLSRNDILQLHNSASLSFYLEELNAFQGTA